MTLPLLPTVTKQMILKTIIHLLLSPTLAASEKIDAIEKGLNKILEGVAVMIVTTCAIPVLVMLTFVWILKSITGLKLPNITQQSIPKVSEMKRKKKAEIDG